MEAETADPQAGVQPKLNATTYGRTGPAIALLHGFGGAGSVWYAIATALAADHRVIVYDLPGHGGSLDFPGGGPPKVAARAVVDDLRARGHASVHLAGHSMGGAIATLAALSAPDLIASLSLVAPGGMGAEINAALLRRFGAAQSVHDIAACLLEMSTPDAADPGRAAETLAEARKSEAHYRKLNEIADLITRDGRQGVIPAAMLASLMMPVSVLWGSADPVLPFAQIQNLPSHFSITALEGKGHMLIEEAPAAILEMLCRQTSLVTGS